MALFIWAEPTPAQIRPTFADRGEVKETKTTPVINRTPTRSTKVSRPANGMLVVMTEPRNAEVYIDGRLVKSLTDGEFMKELPSGRRYRVKVAAGEDYKPFETTVLLRPGGGELIPAALPLKYGTIKIFPAKEGLTIHLDGKALPVNSLAVDNENNIVTVDKLAPGPHKVTYDVPGYVIYERAFTVSAGSVHTWNLEPARAVVALTVQADPGVEVYVDGKNIGKTAGDGALKEPEIEVGEREIKLAKEFYKEHRETLRFEYGKPVSIRRKLEPLPTAGEFDDNFDVPSQKWTMPARSGATISLGRLTLQNSGLVYATDINYRDFDMGFHLKLENAGGAAWAVRSKDPDDYYLFYLSGPEGAFKNTFLTYIVRDNKVDLNSPASSAPVIFDLKAGEQYQIEIKAAGNRIEHTITPARTGRSEKFGFFEDAKNTYPYGGIGFRTIGREKFSVDDIFVRPR
jgi:hypothetical protein